MGIDFGSKRVGIALTDEGGAMAFPLMVLPNDERLTEKIVTLAEVKQVKKIVVGHSLTKTGAENPIHEKTKAFIGDLTLALGIPIELEPEQYTTREATHIQGKNEKIDASAASIILNSYITKTKNIQ